MGVDSVPAPAASAPAVPSDPAGRMVRRMVAVWAATAVVLGAGLLTEQATRNGMDAAKPIRERIGMANYSAFAAPAVSGVVKGKRTAILFVRSQQANSVCDWAAGTPLGDVTMVVVAPENVDCKGLPLSIDPDRKLADGFGMRRSKDDGYPVGFALLDSSGGLRYTTLARDYEKRNWWDRHLYRRDRWEMQTVLKEIS
jgi:hypothetical protein